MHIFLTPLLAAASPATVLFKPWDVPVDHSTPALPCWRIPAIGQFRTASGYLIVLSEGRWQNGDGCEVPGAPLRNASATDECSGYYRAIFYRESNDYGATWGPIHRLAGHDHGCLFDPAVAFAPYAGGFGRLVVQYGAGGGGTWQQTRSLHDDGTWADWSLPQKILPDQLGPDAGFHSPAGGLRLTSKPAPWRIAFSGYGGPRPTSVGVWYSDDGGDVWHPSTVRGCTLCDGDHFTGDVAEPTLAQLRDGEVVLSMRVDGKPTRRAAISRDGGATFDEDAAPRGLSLPDTSTGNQGSLLSTAEGALYYSMTLSAVGDRMNMTALRSDDGGATWPSGIVVYPGPSAYSDVVELSEGRLGIAYERDISGCVGESCSIVFERIPSKMQPYAPPLVER